jgi:hypothetical protein
MKTPISTIFPILFLATFPISAQESMDTIPVEEQQVVIAKEGVAHILGNINDGTPSPPAPKPEPIEFEVLRSHTKRVHVVESPEMPGLPAPEGTINVTVQLVKDPGLPDPPPPLPASPPDDPAVLARMEELREEYKETQLVFVSATVYDHSRTFLRCYPTQHHTGMRCRSPKADFGVDFFQAKPRQVLASPISTRNLKQGGQF